MGLLTTVFGGDPIGALKGIIEQFHMSPEQKAQFQEAVDANAEVWKEKVADWDVKLNDIAGQNIRTETSSSDWFVRRARPAFLWVMVGGVAMSVFVFPIVNVALHKGLTYPQIPTDYMGLFRDAFLGYTIARTVEKAKDKD